MKKRTKFIVLSLLVTGAILGGIFIYWFLNGSPWMHNKAKNLAIQYIADEYNINKENLRCEGTMYNFGIGDDYAVTITDMVSQKKYHLEIKFKQSGELWYYREPNGKVRE